MEPRPVNPDADLVPPAACQARELICAHLPVAGSQYCWAELLPVMITTILERARPQADLTPGDRCRLESAARRAAHDWVPLHELERVAQIVADCVCRALWATAEPGRCDSMLGLSRWAADRLPEALGILRGAYIAEMRRLGTRRPDDVIISALLDGGDVRAVARAAGRPLPEPCALIAIACAGNGDGLAGPGAFSFTAPPDAVLAALAGVPGVVCAPNWDSSALIAMFGVPPGPVGASVRSVRLTAERAVAACESAHGRAFVAGLAVSAAAAGATSAAREAMDVAVLLARRDPARRVAFSEDAVADVLAGSHAALRRRLSARVAEVAVRPDLWATLREFYRADLDRGRTARRLGIHRSTLDYRLNRIEQLTDASPASVHGILLFTAALAITQSPGRPVNGYPSCAEVGRNVPR